MLNIYPKRFLIYGSFLGVLCFTTLIFISINKLYIQNTVDVIIFLSVAIFAFYWGFHGAKSNYISLDYIIQISTILIFGGLIATWITALAWFLGTLLIHTKTNRTLFQTIGISLHNVGVQICIISGGSAFYNFIGGTYPLGNLTLLDFVRIIGLFIAMQIINIAVLIFGTWIRGASIKTYLQEGKKLALIVEAGSVPAGIIVALLYNAFKNWTIVFLFFLIIFAVILVVKNLMETRDNLKNHLNQLDTVNKIGYAITSSLKLDEIVKLIYEECKQLFEFDSFHIAFYNPEKAEFDFKLHYDKGKKREPMKLKLGQGLISYVIETKKPLLIKNWTTFEEYIQHKAIIIDEQPLSFLSVPIIYKEKVLGTISVSSYQANSFNEFHTETLMMLAYQSAIAIENANLYKELEEYKNELEKKVEERTKELEEQKRELEIALKKLKDTQVQLIQSEKMASLGQLVAGIAHEINNPIGFIYANTTHLKEYISNLNKIINEGEKLLNETQKLKFEEIKKEIDYEYIITDLESLIRSYKSGSERIKNIVNDLKNFSRLDQAKIKEIDINESIENTVNIFLHQYESKIKIYKNFGDMPRLLCYPDQLNQVFMNLLLNAVQGIESKEKNISRNGDRNFKGEIWIKTYFQDNNFFILIKDNGCGIPENIRNKIFDPFFTTKPIGKGTGLGLSISYKIIEKHKGKISVSSKENVGTEFIVKLPAKNELYT